MLRRNTKQREIVLEELRGTKTHPGADIIFRMVKKRIPAIGLATVYRNLNILKEEGKIVELPLAKSGCRYDGNINPHGHLICIYCRNIFDIPSPPIRNLSQGPGYLPGFKVKYKRVNFYGYCRVCNDKKTKKEEIC